MVVVVVVVVVAATPPILCEYYCTYCIMEVWVCVWGVRGVLRDQIVFMLMFGYA